MADRPLPARALNRATLDRQLLLRREPMPAARAIEHLAGLQAQAPLAPYVGLWTRLEGFAPAELVELYTERAVARAPMMRATVHLVSRADLLLFRPLFTAMMARGLRANYGRDLAGVDLTELAELAGSLLAGRPLTRVALGQLLAERWPDAPAMSLAYAATYLVPVVQVPPRGIWGTTGPAAWSAIGSWAGAAIADGQDVDAAERLVLRFLAAYGPASVADIQAWSGLSRLREITGRLGARLRGYGRLLDLADAVLPDPDTPAPPRFLPEYDNVLLGYADRSRVIPHERTVPLAPGNGANEGTLLVDGQWLANWKIERPATLRIIPFGSLARQDISDITEEGLRLLAFIAPQAASPDVRFS